MNSAHPGPYAGIPLWLRPITRRSGRGAVRGDRGWPHRHRRHARRGPPARPARRQPARSTRSAWSPGRAASRGGAGGCCSTSSCGWACSSRPRPSGIDAAAGGAGRRLAPATCSSRAGALRDLAGCSDRRPGPARRSVTCGGGLGGLGARRSSTRRAGLDRRPSRCRRPRGRHRARPSRGRHLAAARRAPPAGGHRGCASRRRAARRRRPRSPCLWCLDLHRSDRDEAWPTVMAQVARLVPTTTAGCRAGPDAGEVLAHPGEPGLAQLVAGTVAALVARSVAGERPPPGVAVEVSLPWPRLDHRRWRPHPRCHRHAFAGPPLPLAQPCRRGRHRVTGRGVSRGAARGTASARAADRT